MHLQGTESGIQPSTPPPPPPPPAPEADPAIESQGTQSANQQAGTATGSDVQGNAGAAEAAESGAPDPSRAVTDAVQSLDSDGDRAVFDVRAEAKGAAFGVGGKAQYGYQAVVTQVGGDHPDGTPGNAPAEFELAFDKRLLGGITGELPVPGVDTKGELNLRSWDGVTMTFDSRDDAARAVQILGRVAATETLRDTASAAGPGPVDPGVASNPLIETGGGDRLSGGTMPPGAPPSAGPVVVDAGADAIAPSEADQQFLADNVTAYTTMVDGQARLALEGDLANLGLSGRLDTIGGVRRTLELPQGEEPGRLTYTLIGQERLSTKERVVLGAQFGDQFEAGLRAQNRVENGRIGAEISLSWDVPADQMGPTVSGRDLPEAGSLSGSGLGAPDTATINLFLNHQTQSLLDLSRPDGLNNSITLTVDDPTASLGRATGHLLAGDIDAAAATMGENAQLQLQRDTVRRDGFDVQPGAAVKAFDVFEAEVSMIVEGGVDDVTARETVHIGGTPANGPEAPANELPPPPGQPASDQVVVVPREGLNIRTNPDAGAERSSVLQHGTFLDPTGRTAQDESGRQWVEVTGTDAGDREVQGWVASDLVRPHAEGAMDETGRINPDLERQGFVAHTVQQGENIWEIAHAHGADFEDTMALNAEHLIDLSLVFEGDTVYLPVRNTVPTQPPSANDDATPPPAAEPPTDASPHSAPGESAPAESAPPAGSPSTPPGDAPESAPPTASGDGASSGTGDPTPSDTGSRAAPDEPTTPSASAPSDSGSGGVSTPEPAEPAEPAPVTPQQQAVDDRGDLGDIRQDYQVIDQPNDKTFNPDVDFGLFEVDAPFGIGEQGGLTQGEVDALETLSNGEQFAFRDIAQRDTGEAYRVADGHYSPDMIGREDGHNDAFRHAYLNARLTQEFGADFAEAFGTAHEAVPGNETDREAMDLYNNELGRRIATENPDASAEQLAQLVHEAVENGEALVIDTDGRIAWSDQVEPGRTGLAADGTAPGAIDAGEVAVTESS